eukprot:1159516-Pelagomonas_calceolata.AAC.5
MGMNGHECVKWQSGFCIVRKSSLPCRPKVLLQMRMGAQGVSGEEELSAFLLTWIGALEERL